MFESAGYELKFIQKQRIRDNSAHLYSFIYKFNSPVTKIQYILKADYHQNNIFAIKFYAKKDRKSDNKYSKITNKGDVQNILLTCLTILPILLKDYPDASFCFIGSPSIDKKSNRIENFSNNQRFRIYRDFVSRLIGEQTFAHFEYKSISGYSLINRKNKDLEQYEKTIREMFCNTYNDLISI